MQTQLEKERNESCRQHWKAENANASLGSGKAMGGARYFRYFSFFGRLAID